MSEPIPNEAKRPQETVLGRVHGIKIVKPNPSAISLVEGLHLQVVKDDTERPWTEEDPKECLKKAYYSLAGAKVDAEGRYTEDLWANVQFNSHPGFERGVQIIGRNPNSDTAWGKPITIKPSHEFLSYTFEKKLTDTFHHYLPRWEKTLPKIELFKDGINQVDPNSKEYQEEAAKHEEARLVFLNDKFEVVVVLDYPHLSGLHLVVHPRRSYWGEDFLRAWQTPLNQAEFPSNVQGLLEANAILIGAERILLQEEHLPFYNPEIHFSGNWARDLQPTDKGGKLNLENLASEISRKREKQKHRAGGLDQWQTAMHGHLYTTRDPKVFVELPERPRTEVPNQWKNIQPATNEEVEQVENILNTKLNGWLEQNMRGGLA